MADKNVDPMAHLRPRELADLPIDSGLSMLTGALFFEWAHHSSCTIVPPFCLKAHDHTNNGIVYRSMYQEFMKHDSEYAAAIAILGSYPHWLKLCKSKWFHEEVSKWRDEMRLRDEALAKEKLVLLTKANNVTAAKALLAEAKQTTGKVGRPSKKPQRKTPGATGLDALLDRHEALGD